MEQRHSISCLVSWHFASNRHFSSLPNRQQFLTQLQKGLYSPKLFYKLPRNLQWDYYIHFLTRSLVNKCLNLVPQLFQ
uniref:Uncharacterized protein n=1 Tax=Rhizophora mucronata TaxID=61149 RepID=A0A2P2QS99_RHIMU